MASARSPSPNPARPSNHHRPNTPDNSSSIRRSGGFVPSKPTISSDAPQKIPPFKPGREVHAEQRENERGDPKTPRFMSPTVSAASKDVALTPRKKVLSERNEVSAVVSDSVEEISIKPEVGYGGARVVLGPAISPKQSASGAEEFSMDLEIKNRKYVASPSEKPYDPKTNYLSPRPRFLCYKPNPRVEQYRDMEGVAVDVGEWRKLEDSFSSQSHEDTSGSSEEESQSSLADLASLNNVAVEEVAQSFLTQQDCEDVASPIVGVVEQVIHETHVPKPETQSKTPIGSNFKPRSKLSPLAQQSCEDIASPIMAVVEQMIHETHVPDLETQPKTPIGSNFKPRSKLFPLPQQDCEDVASPIMAVVEQEIKQTPIPVAEPETQPKTLIGNNFKPRSKFFPLPQQDCEDVASPIMAVVEQEINQTPVPVAEPETQQKTPIGNNFKPRSKFFPLVLVLVLACLFAPLTDSPLISSSFNVLKSGSFPTQSLYTLHDLHLEDYVDLANLRLNQIADRFRHWSVAYFSSMASHPKELGPIVPVNLTFSVVDQNVGFDFINSATAPNQDRQGCRSERAAIENIVEEESGFGLDLEQEIAMEGSEYIKQDDSDYDDSQDMGLLEENIVMEKQVELELEAENFVMQIPENVHPTKCGLGNSIEDGIKGLVMQIPENIHPTECGLDNRIEKDGIKRLDQEEDNSTTQKLLETENDIREQPESTSLVPIAPNQSPSSHSLIEFVDAYRMSDTIEASQLSENIHPTECGLDNRIEEDGIKGLDQEEENSTTQKLLETENDIREQPESTSLVPITPNQAPSSEASQLSEIDLDDDLSAISVAVTTIVIVAMVILFMKRKPATADVYQGLSPKNPASISYSSENYRHGKWSPFDNVPVGMDCIGDTGPSEMSSSLHSSSSFSLQRGRSRGEENLSSERKIRRESTVSSMSYGSFTTYERISAKKGCRDEDAVTPVRRSSRIRNQITPP